MRAANKVASAELTSLRRLQATVNLMMAPREKLTQVSRWTPPCVVTDGFRPAGLSGPKFAAVRSTGRLDKRGATRIKASDISVRCCPHLTAEATQAQLTEVDDPFYSALSPPCDSRLLHTESYPFGLECASVPGRPVDTAGRFLWFER